MTNWRHRTRFCRTPEGLKLAYSTIGEGPPLVVVAGWVTHLEFDLECPVRRHWYDALAADWAVTRFDSRGFGLSDRDVGDQSLDTIVEDLSSVVENAGLKRFSLLGLLDGAAAALSYADRHPERVSRLLLHSGYVRGMLRRCKGPEHEGVTRVMIEQVERAWDSDHPIARDMFLSAKCPEASPESRDRFIDIARQSAIGRDALGRLRALANIEVSEAASRVACPTLVTHAKGDLNPPFSEGRLMASLIPRARFAVLKGRSNIIQPHEPAWTQWLSEAREFLRLPDGDTTPFSALSPREAQLAVLVARGLGNAQIAAHLSISEKTVRNHITRVFAKLGVETRAQAIVQAHKIGLGETRQ